MSVLLGGLVLGAALVAVGAMQDARAQAPAPPAIEGNVYSVTYVEVLPTSRTEAVALLAGYRARTRQEDGVAAVKELADAGRASPGNVRFEVVQQANRPNHFTVVEIWNDAAAVQMHSMAEATRRFRDRLAPISGALYDERMYKAVE